MTETEFEEKLNDLIDRAMEDIEKDDVIEILEQGVYHVKTGLYD